MLKNLIRRLQRYAFAELFNELAAIRLELARRNEVLEGALLAIALERATQASSSSSSNEAA
ncbi:hypothetical protein GCM10010909_20860 [Acidocella aquatica]|uniref:Transposase n=1 Tax=Acidocella aquatica TaxID=1922313 RepID=A0ABQ6A4J0_9PROT|nr:hypothetical protein [Acidocella aquatica]GLR67405.1 hypothetical protein GCM10010909_20860 [Acidocella aquatica]